MIEFTGCTVFFPEYGTKVIGDMYKVGTAYVLYGNAPVPADGREVFDYTMAVEFHKETSPYQVWVSTNVRRLY